MPPFLDYISLVNFTPPLKSGIIKEITERRLEDDS
jgi:hypothetical protein